jgi:hypothetical protein
MKSAVLDREMMDIRKCITEYAKKNEIDSQENSMGIDYILDKIKNKKWADRGFLYGPVCPIYGVGAVSLTAIAEAVSERSADGYAWWQVFLVSFFGSIILEYVTSWALEKLFHAYWWDYSNMPLNIHGRVGSLAGRIIFLIVAIICTGIGAALSLNMRIVPNPGDGIVQTIADAVQKDNGFVKNCVVTCATGLIFAGKIIGIGIGTLIIHL